MHISELCIRRPVMTWLLAIAAVVAGSAAYFRLPVAAVPRVDFPVISVFATFPGASPETMATSVALPLEREFSTIAGLESLSVIAVIGVLLLIGLVKKNAIMMVDVALHRQRGGESALEAVRHACCCASGRS